MLGEGGLLTLGGANGAPEPLLEPLGPENCMPVNDVGLNEEGSAYAAVLFQFRVKN